MGKWDCGDCAYVDDIEHAQSLLCLLHGEPVGPVDTCEDWLGEEDVIAETANLRKRLKILSKSRD